MLSMLYFASRLEMQKIQKLSPSPDRQSTKSGVLVTTPGQHLSITARSPTANHNTLQSLPPSQTSARHPKFELYKSPTGPEF